MEAPFLPPVSAGFFGVSFLLCALTAPAARHVLHERFTDRVDVRMRHAEMQLQVSRRTDHLQRIIPV